MNQTNKRKQSQTTKHDKYMPFQDYDATKQRSCIYLQLSIYSQERGFDTLGTFAKTKCASKTQKSVELHPLKSPTYSPHNKKRAEIFIFSVVEVFWIPAIVRPPFSFLTFIFELRLISLLLHYGVGPMQSVLSQ